MNGNGDGEAQRCCGKRRWSELYERMCIGVAVVAVVVVVAAVVVFKLIVLPGNGGEMWEAGM